MREKVAVVDDHDKVLTIKYRDELLPTDTHRIVAIWVTNDSNQVLLAQRALHKKLHPGLWGPAAAGAVSHNETYDEAAKKELFEEIGLKDDNLTLVTKQLYKIDGEQRFIAWYKMSCDKKASQFTLEHDVAEVRWFDLEQLKSELAAVPNKFVPSFFLWNELFLD